MWRIRVRDHLEVYSWVYTTIAVGAAFYLIVYLFSNDRDDKNRKQQWPQVEAVIQRLELTTPATLGPNGLKSRVHIKLTAKYRYSINTEVAHYYSQWHPSLIPQSYNSLKLGDLIYIHVNPEREEEIYIDPSTVIKLDN